MTLHELIEELNRYAAELGDGDAAVRLVVRHGEEGLQYELLDADLYREVVPHESVSLQHEALDALLHRRHDTVLLFAGQQPAVMDWP